MVKRVDFNIEEGNFEEGFKVTVQVWEIAQPRIKLLSTPQPRFKYQIDGWLPPAPQVCNDYKNWQDVYRRLGNIQRITIPPSQITNVSSVQECETAAEALKASLNEWLNRPSARTIERQLPRATDESAPVRFILKTRNPLLKRFPWHLWSFLEECHPQAEVALSADTKPYFRKLKSPVKILGILGSKRANEKTSFEADLALLEKLPTAVVKRLETNDIQILYDNLHSNTSWDILFFAGHSFSHPDAHSGAIVVGQADLPLRKLRQALKEAVRKGLKLAIFNSCDGLGLAQDLADLEIPYIIVMREPIPDVVAHRFARYFLESFAQGKSFYTSVQMARRRLQEEMEGNYPCASWLPVIFQNPLAPELTYPRPVNWRKVALVAAGVAIATSIAALSVDEILFRNRISQGEKILVDAVKTPDKVAGVQALKWKNYSQAINNFENSLRQNRNDPETLIYLNNARIGDRPAFEVATVVPIGSNLNVAQEMLRGIAQAQDEINLKGGVQGKPLKVTISNDENQPGVAKRMAATFVRNPQILAVIGHNASDASVAAAPIYNKGGLLMITPTSFSDKLSSVGKYVFRMVPSIWYIANKLAQHIYENNPQAKVAICSDIEALDNESFRNQFTTALLEKKVSFINVKCDFSEPGFEPNAAITRMIDRGANTLLLAPHVDRVGKVVEIAQANQGRLALFGSPTPYTAKTLSGEGAANGLTLVVPWHPVTQSSNQFSRNALKRWGGAVNWRTALSYDTMQAIATALQKSQTRQELSAALQSPEFSAQGASGTIQFLPSGERQVVPGIGVLVRVQPSSRSPFGYDFMPLQ